MSDVTRLLKAMDEGDPEAAGQLIELIYRELRRMATAKMANEKPGHTLQPTALVHEVWLKLFGRDSPKFTDRAQFFACAGRAMRQVLVDSARRKLAAKRPDSLAREEFDEIHLTQTQPPDEVLDLDEALKLLEVKYPEEARLVELRFFVGLSEKDAAEAQGYSARTASKKFAFAKGWLLKTIKEGRKR